jgi:hypothetical protein
MRDYNNDNDTVQGFNFQVPIIIVHIPEINELPGLAHQTGTCLT